MRQNVSETLEVSRLELLRQREYIRRSAGLGSIPTQPGRDRPDLAS